MASILFNSHLLYIVRKECLDYVFVLPRTEAQMAKGIGLVLLCQASQMLAIDHWSGVGEAPASSHYSLPWMLHGRTLESSWTLARGKQRCWFIGHNSDGESRFSEDLDSRTAGAVGENTEWSPSLSPTPHTKATEGNFTSVCSTVFIRFYMRRGTWQLKRLGISLRRIKFYWVIH